MFGLRQRLGLSALFCLTAVQHVASQDACQSAPSCLQKNVKVRAVCSNATVIETKYQSTTILGWITERTSQDATSQVTVDITRVFTMPSVLVVQSTVTSVATVTDSCNASSRNRIRQDAPSCNDARAISFLNNLQGTTLAAACACLGQTVPTSTTTLIQTSTMPSTTTVIDGVPSTTTRYFLSNDIETRTVTNIQTRIITSRICSQTPVPAPTQTQIAPYSPPKQVFGPQSDCQDVGASSDVLLQDTIRDLTAATETCVNQCRQTQGCRHVYVQELLPDAQRSRCEFQCYFHDKPFDRNSDVQCGKTGMYLGAAVGFDVGS